MKYIVTLLMFAVLSTVSFGQAAAKKDDAGKTEGKKLVRAGMLKIAGDDYEGAIKDFNSALKKDSTSLDAYLKRAFCYNYLQKYEEAISDYSTVIRMQPNHAFSFLSRGSAKNKLGKYSEAIVDFNKVIDIGDKGEKVDGKEPSKESIDALKNNIAQAYFNRGEAKKGLGNVDEACKDWSTSAKKGNEEAKIVMKNNHCK